MAKRSIAYNNLQEKIHITAGNIAEASSIYGKHSFDAIVTNPPYMIDKHGLKNPALPKAIARHEILCRMWYEKVQTYLNPKKAYLWFTDLSDWQKYSSK